jgi:hypothetical protein
MVRDADTRCILDHDGARLGPLSSAFYTKLMPAPGVSKGFIDYLDERRFFGAFSSIPFLGYRETAPEAMGHWLYLYLQNGVLKERKKGASGCRALAASQY